MLWKCRTRGKCTSRMYVRVARSKLEFSHGRMSRGAVICGEENCFGNVRSWHGRRCECMARTCHPFICDHTAREDGGFRLFHRDGVGNVGCDSCGSAGRHAGGIRRGGWSENMAMYTVIKCGAQGWLWTMHHKNT